MKKLKLLLVLSLFIPLSVFATGYNTSVGNDIGWNGCVNFQDNRITSSGSGYFGHCKQATCYTGVWKTNYYISSDMISCSNGNKNYYVQTINDGCSQYNGACTPTSNYKYCSVVTYYDCTKTKDGKVYINPNSTTTTKKVIPTTKKTTTTTTTTTTTQALDSNNYLSTLKVSVANIDFNKEKLVYDIEIDKTVKYIDVEAVPESSKAQVKVENNDNLSTEKPITITVTAEDNSVRIYTINVNYKADAPVLSGNNLLESIVVKDFKLKFKPSVNNYTIKAKEIPEKLDITVKTQDDKSKYVITGNEKLQNKSKVNIVVTAENGNENIYTITVKKSSRLFLYILLFILLGIAILFIIRLIGKLIPGKKDKNYDYE